MQRNRDPPSWCASSVPPLCTPSTGRRSSPRDYDYDVTMTMMRGGIRAVRTTGNAPYDVSFEYDLAAEDEAGETEASYWLRGSVTPDFAKGAYLLFGYSSEEVLTYGVGYKCSDNMKVITEFNSGLKDVDGNDVENDFSIRASYSF